MINASLIKTLREANGWTQEDLATAAGVGVATIQRAEAGQNMSLGVIEKIARGLGVVTAALLQRSVHERSS